jgi:hypothetical protein
MNQLITEIPSCPDSISTAEARELFMDLCEEKIHQNRLTAEILEAIKGYCFLIQIMNTAESELIKVPGAFEWQDLWYSCTLRQLEYSEMLGLTPLDRKNLGLI